MMKRLLLPILMGLALTVSAAEKGEEGASSGTDSAVVRKEVGEAVDAVTAIVRQERDEFVGKAQKEIAELNKKMAELRKEAEKLGGEAKARLDRRIQNLEPELKAAEKKFADLKSSTGEKWEELKVGVSALIDHLRQGMQKTREDER